MKERPILFSGPMVRALLAGTKTQTRRIIKPNERADELVEFGGDGSGDWHWPEDDSSIVVEEKPACPYGVPGDRLWVKETFARVSDGEKEGTVYRADPDGENGIDRDTGECWKPSIFMPRWLSRITLELTAVRVEPLNDISEADAIAEGIEAIHDNSGLGWPCGWKDYLNPESLPFDHDKPRASYRTLWESINGPGSWALNPWVWVLEFRKL